ncbi:MAG: hypothetical protein HQL32_07985 [Planctomycetes bacterium]|nr:hypothetical protein [Planctomycetota bacterium]
MFQWQDGLLLASFCRIIQWLGEIISFCLYSIVLLIKKENVLADNDLMQHDEQSEEA